MTTARPRHAARILAGVLVYSALLAGLGTRHVAHAQSGCEASTISAPRSGDVLRGTVEILGSASIDAFNFYKLEWAASDDPEQWIAVSEVIASPVRNDRLDTWSTTTLADGNYRLKLTVVDDTFGERCRFTLERLRVANDALPDPVEIATSRAFATAAVTRQPPPDTSEATDDAGAPPSAATATGSPSSAPQGDERLPVGDVDRDTEPPGGASAPAPEGRDESTSPDPVTAVASPTPEPTARPTLEPVLPQSAPGGPSLPRGMGRSFAIGMLLAVLAGLGLAVLLLRR